MSTPVNIICKRCGVVGAVEADEATARKHARARGFVYVMAQFHLCESCYNLSVAEGYELLAPRSKS